MVDLNAYRKLFNWILVKKWTVYKMVLVHTSSRRLYEKMIIDIFSLKISPFMCTVLLVIKTHEIVISCLLQLVYTYTWSCFDQLKFYHLVLLILIDLDPRLVLGKCWSTDFVIVSLLVMKVVLEYFRQQNRPYSIGKFSLIIIVIPHCCDHRIVQYCK